MVGCSSDFYQDMVNIKGLRIAYQYKGRGQPLVLLHGALSDSRVWRRQLDDLSSDFLVVAWDAPGCGRSSDPQENFTLADYADCLAALIERLGLIRPHILGLSFGGGLALEFYHRHPAVPRSLILASAYAGWAGSLPPAVVEERLQSAIEQSELPAEQVVAMWLPSLLSASAPPDLAEEIASIMADFHPVGMRVMANAFARADLREVLPNIKVPTLLLYGAEDRRSPLDVAQKLHDQIPGSRLVVIPGVGHDTNLEAADVFNREVRKFLCQSSQKQ